MIRLAFKVSALMALLLFLNGCATVSKDGGREDVRRIAANRGLDMPAAESAQARVDNLVAEPLSANSAVEIGLLVGPEAQRLYAKLSAGAGEVYQRGRMSNPMLSASVLDPSEPGDRDLITVGLTATLVDLVTLPMRSRLAREEFAALRESVADDFLRLASDIKKSFYRFVAAKQAARMYEQIADAADLSGRLAQRFHSAGNFSEKELVEVQAMASEAKLAFLTASADAYGARHDLASRIGLPLDGNWDAPARLPGVPDSAPDLRTQLALAREQRLDLSAARTRARVTSDRRGMTGWSRWLQELEMGAERERETDGETLKGPTVDWEVPLFNQHRDELLEADAAVMDALSNFRAAQLAVNNDVRLAHAAVLNAGQQVREFQQVLLPHRARYSELAQQEVNFMLIGVFELFDAKQEEYESNKHYLERVEAYWSARIDLASATGSLLISEPTGAVIDIDDLIAPRDDHDGHNMNDHAGHERAEDAEHNHGSRP